MRCGQVVRLVGRERTATVTIYQHRFYNKTGSVNACMLGSVVFSQHVRCLMRVQSLNVQGSGVGWCNV